MTGQIVAAAPAVTANAAQAGWRLASGSVDRGGWPFAATVRFRSASATRPLGGTMVRWTASSLDVTLSPWQPHDLLLAVTGEQTVTLGEGPAMPVQAGLADILVPLSGGPATFEFRDIACALQGGLGLKVAHLTGKFDTLSAGFTADGIAISPAPHPSLRPPFDVPLALSGSLHLSSGFPDAATPGASASAWQQAGGRIEVPAMTLQWGPLHVSGSGEGGLDPDLQPRGRTSLNVVGAPEALDAAGRAGLLAPGPAAAARAVLGLLALASNGGRDRIAIPVQVTLADRTLTVAQFPVLRLPVLDWNVAR